MQPRVCKRSNRPSVWENKNAVLDSFLLLSQNTWCNQLKKRKNLFLFTSAGVSFHNWLTALLLGLQGGNISWQKAHDRAKMLTHGIQEIKDREKGPRSHNLLQGHDYNGLTSSPPGLTSLMFHYLPITPEPGDQAFSTWTFGKHFRSKL
jgi:hypothetical protein